MTLDDICAAEEPEHLRDFSADSEPAPWDPLPTGETLVPADPAATASPAVERHSGPQQVPAVAPVLEMPLWELLTAAFVGGALGAYGGGFALGLTLVWALGL